MSILWDSGTGTGNGEIPSASVDSVEGTIHNNEDDIPYYIYERYYYRIEANEPVLSLKYLPFLTSEFLGKLI